MSKEAPPSFFWKHWFAFLGIAVIIISGTVLIYNIIDHQNMVTTIELMDCDELLDDIKEEEPRDYSVRIIDEWITKECWRT